MAHRLRPSSRSRSRARRPTKGRLSSSIPASIQPRPSSQGVERCSSLSARRDDSKSTRYSSRPASIRAISRATWPNGTRPWGWPASTTRSHTAVASAAGAQDLVAQVAGEAGAGDRDRGVADAGRGVVERAEPTHRRAASAASTACDRGPCTARMPSRRSPRRSPPSARGRPPAGPVGQQARLGSSRGQQVLLGAEAEHHAVFVDEAPVVAPQGVLGLAGGGSGGCRGPSARPGSVRSRGR